jgi:hypothetical protein
VGASLAAAVVRPEHLLHVGRVAEARPRGPARLGGGEAARLVVALAHLQVEAELVVHVGVDVGPPEAEVASPERLAHEGLARRQAIAGAARSACVTAAA